jgi:hypothetical protein
MASKDEVLLRSLYEHNHLGEKKPKSQALKKRRINCTGSGKPMSPRVESRVSTPLLLELPAQETQED